MVKICDTSKGNECLVRIKVYFCFSILRCSPIIIRVCCREENRPEAENEDKERERTFAWTEDRRV